MRGMGMRAWWSRRTGGRPRLLGGLAAAAVGIVALAVGLLDLGQGATPSEATSSEPRLDGSKPDRRPGEAKRGTSSGGKGPTVVQVVPPGGSASRADPSARDELPPKRVLAENAQLRREVDHLKTLEAERRRVSKALARAGVIFDGPVRLGEGGLAIPVAGPIVSPFGQRWGRLHAGVDIAARAGTVIHAAADGGVAIAAPTGGYGNYVCLQHNKRLTTCYAHLSRFLTERGAVVRQGEPIGLVGCTGHCFGDHLHFETWVGGRPVDPLPYL